MSFLDDHHSLKLCLRLLFEEFLNKKNQRKICIKSNYEKLESINKKIISMKQNMERKKQSHANVMKRLLREYAILEKVSESVAFVYFLHLVCLSCRTSFFFNPSHHRS